MSRLPAGKFAIHGQIADLPCVGTVFWGVRFGLALHAVKFNLCPFRRRSRYRRLMVVEE